MKLELRTREWEIVPFVLRRNLPKHFSPRISFDKHEAAASIMHSGDVLN